MSVWLLRRDARLPGVVCVCVYVCTLLMYYTKNKTKDTIYVRTYNYKHLF